MSTTHSQDTQAVRKQPKSPHNNESSETSHGRVDEQAAAANGPGTVTTAKMTGSISLTTPASSSLNSSEGTEACCTSVKPQKCETANQLVHKETTGIMNLNARCAEPMRTVGTSCNPPDELLEEWTWDEVGEVDETPRKHQEVEGSNNDKESQVQTKCIDKWDSWVNTSEDDRTTMTPLTPQSMLLEGKWIPQVSDGSIELTICKPDNAKATQDQGNQSATSTSARRASHHLHGDVQCEVKHPPRLSEDPAEIPGNDKHRPDAPTKLPNMSEGMGGRGSRRRSRRLRSSRMGAEKLRRAVRSVRESGMTMDEAEMMAQQTMPAVTGRGERGSVWVRTQSTTAVEENDQRNITGVKDLHEKFPVPPKLPDKIASCMHESQSLKLNLKGERSESLSFEPELTKAEADRAGVLRHIEGPSNVLKKPYKRSGRVSEPQSVKLKGDLVRGIHPSYDDVPTSDQTDTLESPRCHEDIKYMPNELLNASELEHKCSEPREQEDSPKGTQTEPDKPECKAAMQDGYHSSPEGPTSDGNRCDVDTNVSYGDGAPRTHLGKQGESRLVEASLGRKNIVEGGGIDGTGNRSNRSKHIIKTSVLCRDRGPGGHIEVQEARSDVECDWRRENDVEGAQMDGRVETDSLAEYKSNQHGKCKHTMMGVPEVSKPSTQHPRQPTNHANPPRR
ncbi:hypothetical protein EV363DRAFT_1401974 [Boletus edulis]|nr:hypothetical protein EV363DRAFT_1401974 [Boletus edulis]